MKINKGYLILFLGLFLLALFVCGTVMGPGPALKCVGFGIGMVVPMVGGTLIIYRYVGMERRISVFLFAGLFGFTGAELIIFDAMTSDIRMVDWIEVLILSGKVGIGLFLFFLVFALLLVPIYSVIYRTRIRK